LGFFAPDHDQPGSYFGSIDPSLFGDPDVSKPVPFGIPSLNFARGSLPAALVARAISPYVNAYEDFAVAPMRAALTAVANSPAGDPALYMSLRGLMPGAALPAAVGGLAAKGLHALVGVDRAPAIAVPLPQRAIQFLEALPHPNAIKNRTVALLRTDGETIVGSGTRDLDSYQRSLLDPEEEVEARLPGAHAEITVLHKLQNLGSTPRALTCTRPICPDCQRAIESLGGQLDSPKTATFPAPEGLPKILPRTDEP
jgi:hypothetical protein